MFGEVQAEAGRLHAGDTQRPQQFRCNRREFDVYRLRVSYPLIPTRLWIAQDLPA